MQATKPPRLESLEIQKRDQSTLSQGAPTPLNTPTKPVTVPPPKSKLPKSESKTSIEDMFKAALSQVAIQLPI